MFTAATVPSMGLTIVPWARCCCGVVVLVVLDVVEEDDVLDDPDELVPQLDPADFSAACATERAPSTRCCPDATAWRAGPRAGDDAPPLPPAEPDDECPIELLDAGDEVLEADDDPFDEPLVGVDTPLRALLRVSWAAASVACWAVSCACSALVSRVASVWPAVTA